MRSDRPMMNRTALRRVVGMHTALACASAFALSACLQPWQGFKAGEPEANVIARLGPPSEVYDLPGGAKRLMWPSQPMGEVTTAADIDSAGRVTSVRQVLQQSEFYRAEVGTWMKQDVLVNFGRPVEVVTFPQIGREVWSYRYLEDGVWYQLFHFYFDEAGVLRSMQKSPDPLHEQNDNNRPS